MGAPDFDDVVPRFGLDVDGISQCSHRRNKALLHIDGGGNAHRGRERIVRRLPHVVVIVWMNRRVAAKRRASELGASVGDHFVDVHVELGTAASHPDVQRQHFVVLAGQDFVAGLNDELVSLAVEPLAGMVGDCGGLLQRRIGRDHLARNKILADAEMLEGTLCLSTPQLVSGHFHDAEAVGLFSHRSHDSSPVCYVEDRMS